MSDSVDVSIFSACTVISLSCMTCNFNGRMCYQSFYPIFGRNNEVVAELIL